MRGTQKQCQHRWRCCGKTEGRKRSSAGRKGSLAGPKGHTHSWQLNSHRGCVRRGRTEEDSTACNFEGTGGQEYGRSIARRTLYPTGKTRDTHARHFRSQQLSTHESRAAETRNRNPEGSGDRQTASDRLRQRQAHRVSAQTRRCQSVLRLWWNRARERQPERTGHPAPRRTCSLGTAFEQSGLKDLKRRPRRAASLLPG